MVKIIENYDLSKLNTFGAPAKARYFAEVSSEEEARELFGSEIFKKEKKLFIGGGSNILFTEDFPGIVVRDNLRGIEIISESEGTARIKAMGGEPWAALVDFCAGRGWWGVENLSLIPGTVGAAPMQNIGAYGAELKNSLYMVEALDVQTGEKKTFHRDECDLGYRTSIFKSSLKGKYFITSVILDLKKHGEANTSYRVLSDYLEEKKITVRGPKDVSDAVAEIRRSKLPDPAKIGNAGSFFKNIFVSEEKLAELLSRFPDMRYFREDGTAKIPAGWLIEQCGWKGKKVGRAGVHDKQALVLVNLGGADGKEIKRLAEMIIRSVEEKFGLRLETEVNIC